MPLTVARASQLEPTVNSVGIGPKLLGVNSMTLYGWKVDKLSGYGTR
jgi:hypothetical protein